MQNLRMATLAAASLACVSFVSFGGATIFTIASHSGRWNAEAVKIHLDNVLKPLVEHLGPLVGKSFKHILMDSYEAGDCN